MPLANFKVRNSNNDIIEGVAWLLEDDDDLVDAKGRVVGKVKDLYRGSNVIFETPEGLFAVNPKNVISIELLDLSQFED